MDETLKFDDKKLFEGLKETKGGVDELFDATMGDDVKRVATDVRRVIVAIQKGEEPVGALIALAADAYNLYKNNAAFVKAIADIVAGGRKVGQAFTE